VALGSIGGQVDRTRSNPVIAHYCLCNCQSTKAHGLTFQRETQAWRIKGQYMTQKAWLLPPNPLVYPSKPLSCLLTFVAAKYCEIFPSLDRKFSARLLLLRRREAEKLVDLPSL
jgi:hypothetical protein